MFRKFLSICVIVMLLVVQIIPVSVFANGADAKDVFDEFNGLTDEVKGQLLKYIWDDVVVELTNGDTVDANTVYSELEADITASSATTGIEWSDIISDSETTDDSKISSDTLIEVIQKLINNKSTITYYYGFYSQYADKDLFKYLLFGSSYASKTAGDVYVALLPYTVPILTSDDNGDFVRNGDVTAALAAQLDVKASTFEALVGDANDLVDELAGKMNTDLDLYSGISKDDIINILNINSTYPLYQAPDDDNDSNNDSNNSNNNTGDPIVTPDPQNTLPNFQGGIANINAETDPAKALQLAKTLIGDSIAGIQALKNQGASIESTVTALKTAANAALAKVNTQEVTPTVTSGTAAVVIDTATTTQLIAKLDTIISTAAALNTELAKAAAGTKIESVLLIKVANTNTTVNVGTVSLPSALLSAATDKNIDKIAIDTGIAKISLAPNAITANPAETVAISASKVDTASLSADIKAAVGNNTVYDFNVTAGTRNITNFSKPVEIAIPYTLKTGENADKLTVFYINDKGQLENVVGKYDAVAKTVVFTTKHFSKYIVKENIVTFSDLGSVTWAKDNIESMAAKGIITGTGAGKYNPSAKLTRAQFAAFLVRAYQLEDTSACSAFSDIKSTDWYYSAVCSAYKAGVINGISADKFGPNANVTRQEMAAMIARALVVVKGKDMNADAGVYLNKFTDKNSIASYAVNAANMVSKYGIISGKPGNAFDAKGQATRAEAAVVIYRAFNL